MIGKGKSISHTKASLMYGMNQEKDTEVIFKQNLMGDSASELTQEFKLIQSENHNCNKNTLSFVLSPTIEDGQKLNSNHLNQITNEFMKNMNLGNRQAIAFVHNDKDHKHIHLYVNRINFNGNAYNDSFIGKKTHKAAEKVAKKFNLKTVKQVQQEKLNELKVIRKKVYDKHLSSINDTKCRNLNDYINIMKSNDITVLPVINKKQELQGFRFEYKSIDLKGSDVNRSMSCKDLIFNVYKNKAASLAKEKLPTININQDNVLIKPSVIQGLTKLLAKKLKTQLLNKEL